MSDDTVIIDDDDDDTMQISSISPIVAQTIETIDLDESGTDDEVLAITDISEAINLSKKLDGDILMDQIVHFCLSMENVVGMSRVIKKTLIPLYQDTSTELKNSPSLRKLLRKTLKQLKMDPDHKFLHIKTLCESLKSGRVKRKVPFVTLAKNLKNKDSSKTDNIERTCISNTFHIENAREVNININAYDERLSSKEIDTPRHRNSRTSLRTKNRKTRCKQTYGNIMSTKSLQSTENIEVIDLDNSDTENTNSIDHETSHNADADNNNKENKTQEIRTNCSANNLEDNNKKIVTGVRDYDLLIPSTYLEVTREKDNSVEIQELEEEIVKYKSKIAQLEEAEVFDDTKNSPYILCDLYKSKLIHTYKRIAKLKGCRTDIAKRREIRINAKEGRIAGPAKLLEDRLNESIDKEGRVAFPDFFEVQKCVAKYNKESKSCWNRYEIFKRATALFRHCGEALRKNRQKREYQDMLGWLPREVQLEDPAERDPQLLATLEENKLVAQVKEQEILEKYVHMENTLKAGFAGNPLDFELQQSSSDTEIESDNDDDHDQSSFNIGGKPDFQAIFSSSLFNTENNASCLTDEALPTISASADQKSDNASNSNSTLNPVLSSVSPSEGAENSDENTIVTKCGIKTEKYVSRIEFPDTDDSETNVKSEDEIKIKEEPVDVQNMLDELGDNYVSTVFDIDDPFLVIQLSSESSDDET
ncbi:uncharacterized protein LOC113499190 [Trichoplusia ni]|uniref:Uncharacterized protein LOC113499190 n=1 Tax=Trichoplusia ni TaxID=7111 RepID=A0A7E5W4C7_TRINI|nr:uncharacterized protein LOC113499190 [Trichoplusia ni]